MPQYYIVLFLERAPFSAGDELLSKLLSAEKLIITEHPHNSLLHYSCSSAIIYSRDAAGVCMRIFYRMRSQQQSSCAFPQNPALSMTPGEESLCGLVVCNYKVTLCQCRYSMLFFSHFFPILSQILQSYGHRITIDIWILFDGVLKVPDGGRSIHKHDLVIWILKVLSDSSKEVTNGLPRTTVAHLGLGLKPFQTHSPIKWLFQYLILYGMKHTILAFLAKNFSVLTFQ